MTAMKVVALGGLVLALGAGCGVHIEQRDRPAKWRMSSNNAFFDRHNDAFRSGAAIHVAHGLAHDVLQLTPIGEAPAADAAFDRDMVEAWTDRVRMEPAMMLFGPHTGQAAWRLYLTIDWTHHHHEVTYDILSDADVPWHRKAAVTREAERVYLGRLDEARSPAPLDLTMRRAAVMMKPYFSTFRNVYPRSNNFFYVAHWWHPAVYEAQMIAGNDAEQDASVAAVQALIPTVLGDRPQRMLLSREMMPRYARMAPASANIFDNLHMLHGIAYDILAYEGWSIDEKRDELERVVDAMAQQPDDEDLAGWFEVPHAGMDPRSYDPWMKPAQGSMNQIMAEMMEEMWPKMSPDGSATVPSEVKEQMKLKLTPGMQPGEIPGSLHDAVMKLVPGMKMDRDGQRPGATPKHASMMVEKWRQKARSGPRAEPLPMHAEPALPPPPASPSRAEAPR